MAKSADPPTNWEAVPLPDHDDYPEYSTEQRRAMLYQAILRAGSPELVHHRRFADRFDVHPSTITRDKAAIGEDVAAALREAGAEGMALEVKATYSKVVSELLREEDYEAAWKVCREWVGLLADAGVWQREPTRMEVEHREASEETEEYVVIEVDGDVPDDGDEWEFADGQAELPGGRE